MSWLIQKKQVTKECGVINIITCGQDFLKNMTSFWNADNFSIHSHILVTFRM